MEPSFPALTSDDASVWQRSSPPRGFVRWGLLIFLAGAIAVSVATDTTRCTVQQPCGPDPTFGVMLALVAVGALGLFAVPPWGTALLAIAGLFGAIFDPAVMGRVMFAMFAVFALAQWLWLRTLRRRQHQGLATAARVLPSQLPRQIDPMSRRPAPVPIVLAAVALIASVALCGWYRHLLIEQEGRVARAVVVQGSVEAETDGGIRVRFTDLSQRSVTKEFTPNSDLSNYPVGTAVAVVIDPVDPSWQQLAAEPGDPVGWLFGGVALGLLGAGMIGFEVRTAAVRRRLLGHGGPARAVRAVPDLDGNIVVLPRTGSTRPLGRFSIYGFFTDEPDEEMPDHAHADEPQDFIEQDREEFGRLVRGDIAPESLDEDALEPEITDGVIFGELALGGWCALLTDDGLLLPAGPLRWAAADFTAESTGPPEPVTNPIVARLPRPLADLYGRGRTAEDVIRGSLDRGELPGAPVGNDESSPLPEVPLVLDAPLVKRVLGVVMVAVGLVGVPVFTWWVVTTWFSRVVVLYLGFQLITEGFLWATAAVRADHDGLRVHERYRRRRVLWADLHGVRIAENTLILVWQPDVIFSTGQFAAQHGDGVADAAEAQQVGSMLMALRQRALDRGAASLGYAVSRPSWVWVPVGLLVLGWLAAIALR